jgi:hypothetical protein
MTRRKIGIITLALLGLGALLFFVPLESHESAQTFRAAFWRVGLVMGAWWLAFDELNKLPRWLLWLVPLVIVLAASTKRFLPVAIICVAVAFLLNLRLPGQGRGS